MCPKSSTAHRCFITSCFYRCVGQEFLDGTQSRCEHGVLFKDHAQIACGSFVCIFPQYITKLDTTVKITE